jgi:hypothetical protein
MKMKIAQSGGAHRDEEKLRFAVGAAGGGRREDRHHERERGHDDECGEASADSFHAEHLLAMFQSAHQDADAGDAVADDHERGIDRVARQHRHVIPAGHHHRKDQRGLDRGDGQRENQRAKGLAHAMGNHFGMMHGDKHRSDQRRAAQRSENDPNADSDCHDQQRDRRHRNEPGPQRKVIAIWHGSGKSV